MFVNFRQLMLFVGAGTLLVACQAADGTSQAPDKALVNAVMTGLGAVDPNEKPIEYKPRAPLAMPANSGALPEPSTQVAGSKSAAWPKSNGNADLNRVKTIYADGSDDPSKRLSTEQMRGLNVSTNKKRDFENEKRTQEILSGDEMTLEEMAAQSNNPNSPNSAAMLERKREQALKREYLTQPPTAYSTPSENAPMPTLVETKKGGAKYDKYDGARLDMKCLEETGGECRR
ncbi:MAG: hypothetical protein HWE23_12510 [Rhodobacteraceae bacterium]|nr:hypothetical protein [Paracoccaceae bacterium]